MLDALEARRLMAFVAHVGFQPRGAVPYPGYVADQGAAFGDRQNGYAYGWVRPNRSASANPSSLAPDARYAAGAAIAMGQKWELAVPDGLFQVRVVAGNVLAPRGRVRLAVEGVIVVDEKLSKQARWVDGTAVVDVQDGRLTLTRARGATAARVCFIEVTQLDSPGGSVEYTGPIVIRQGGVYRGNWQSLDPDVPAVRVDTSEPVVIEDATLRSRGALIEAGGGTNVIVRNTSGYGMDPARAGHYPGRFLDVNSFSRVEVRNCYLEGTSGIYVGGYRGDHTAGQSVMVIGNRAKNIDGRYSDGAGEFAARAPHAVQFFQIDSVKDLPGVEVAWNEVINEPGRSAVEDNVSVFASSGTPDSPISIHDNYIQGAYPPDPSARNYSGGGIMLSDGGSSYVRAVDNQVVNTTNYGIAISSGSHNVFRGNRIVSSGRLPDGRVAGAQNVGAYIWNQRRDRSFTDNSGIDNSIGWAIAGTRRNDWWVPDAAEWAGNEHAPGPVTAASEAAELAYWKQKVATARVSVGPVAPLASNN
jgi:parallel beta-helix repeat protein